MSACDVGVAAERLDVDGDAAGGLGAVDHDERAARMREVGDLADWHAVTGRREEVREDDDLRVWPDAPREGLDDRAWIVGVGGDGNVLEADAACAREPFPS